MKQDKGRQFRTPFSTEHKIGSELPWNQTKKMKIRLSLFKTKKKDWHVS